MEDERGRPEPTGLSETELAAWQELALVARRLDGEQDAEIASALQGALASKVEKLQKSVGFTQIPASLSLLPHLRKHFPDLPVYDDATPATEEANAEEITEPQELTPEQRSQIDNMLRQANVAQLRGNHNESEEILQAALALAPGCADVLEGVGDHYAARGNLRKAREVYQRAKKLDPENISIEKKYANAVFQVGNAAIMADTLRIGGSAFEQQASARAAVYYSLFIPGSGQITLGEVGKGIVLLLGWLGSWIGVFVVGFDNILRALGLLRDEASQPVNMLAFLFLASAALFHLSAVFDVSARAKAVPKAKRRESIEHPKPPVDLPYD